MNKISIICLKPAIGGTTAMLGRVIESLKISKMNIEVAYYEPFSIDKNNLSVRIWDIFKRCPSHISRSVNDRHVEYCVGVYFPALEAGHYLLNRFWYNFVKQSDVVIVVSGSVIPALPAVLFGKKPLIWVATPYMADRVDRVSKYGFFRKSFDRLIDAPINRIVERYIVKRSNILSLSNYTARKLNEICKVNIKNILPMPVDKRFFNNSARYIDKNSIVIGYSGRFTDPRKNFDLALETIKILVKRYPNIIFKLLGDVPDKQIASKISTLNLVKNIDIVGHVEHGTMHTRILEFDILLLTSYQEGLAIACLEAMASSIPVVSTRCGGVEDYIIDGINGYLCDFNATDISSKVIELIENNNQYRNISKSAHDTIMNDYSTNKFDKVFSYNLREVL